MLKGLQVVEVHPLFPYFLEKRLAIPTSPFFHLLVNGFSVKIIIIIIIIHFFIRVISEFTEAVTTSFIPIDAILPEICDFIIGFSCTVWTKMMSLQDH